jgi:ABC-type sugar transport system substrate-binding protein
VTLALPAMRGLLAAVAMLAPTVAGCATNTPVVHTGAVRHAGRLRGITYINPLPGDPIWDRIGVCMTRAAARHGIAVHTVGPAGGDVDTQQMENILSQTVADRAQAIVTWSAGAPAAFDVLFAKARANGSVVATLLSPSATGDQNFEVGLDTALEVRLEIQAIARRAGAQHVGVILQYAAGPGSADAIAAVRNEVQRHANVTLSDLEFDAGTFSNDLTITATMLTAHPEINVIVNYSGFPGVIAAIQERHLVGKVSALVGSDFPRAVVGYIGAGVVAGVVYIDGCRTGKLTVDRLLDAWAGRPVPRLVDDGTRVVTGREFKRLAARGAS